MLFLIWGCKMWGGSSVFVLGAVLCPNLELQVAGHVRSVWFFLVALLVPSLVLQLREDLHGSSVWDVQEPCFDQPGFPFEVSRAKNVIPFWSLSGFCAHGRPGKKDG